MFKKGGRANASQFEGNHGDRNPSTRVSCKIARQPILVPSATSKWAMQFPNFFALGCVTSKYEKPSIVGFEWF